MSRSVCIIGPGNNVHVHRWAEALRQRDLRVSLISTLPAVLPESLRDLPIFTIPTAAAGMTRAQRLATLLGGWARVPGLVAALRPDVVHIHSLPTPAAVPFLRLLPRLVVSTWGSDVVQRDPRKTRLYPYLLRHARQLTATSHYLATITAGYLHTLRPISVIPFGIDSQRFTPGQQSAVGKHIGTLRHLEANYGIDVLIEAVPLLLASDREIQIAIGGAGSLQSSFERRIHELEIGDHVALRGRIAHAEVPAFLRSLAVFAMPSRAEAFGVAALEAQVCGLPVVASHVGGLPEVVRDGETGLLVPPEQPQALAHALLKLIEDPQLRARMGETGREWVRARYDWRTNVEQMLEVYRQVWG
ncbi:MAG: glycosyltransferase family 4 protein [Chloroflexi bacterium]|nr:glycosyltransferase family 4 protein [Chloroflexota bacterium]